MPKQDASLLVGVNKGSVLYGENSIFITGQKGGKTNTQTISFNIPDGLFTIGNKDNRFSFDFVNNLQEIPSQPQAYELGTLLNSSYPPLKEIIFRLISPQPETEESDNEEKPQDATAYTENSNSENDEIPDQNNNENNSNPSLDETPINSEVSNIDGQQTTLEVSSEEVSDIDGQQTTLEVSSEEVSDIDSQQTTLEVSSE